MDQTLSSRVNLSQRCNRSYISISFQMWFFRRIDIEVCRKSVLSTRLIIMLFPFSSSLATHLHPCHPPPHPTLIPPTPSVQRLVHTTAEFPSPRWSAAVSHSWPYMISATNGNEGRAPTRTRGSNCGNVRHEFLAAVTDCGLTGTEQPAAPITVHFVCAG